MQEDNGNKSSMRLMCLMSLGASVLFGVLTVLGIGGSQTDGTGLYITTLFTLAAFAPKAVQKFIEEKVPR